MQVQYRFNFYGLCVSFRCESIAVQVELLGFMYEGHFYLSLSCDGVIDETQTDMHY